MAKCMGFVWLLRENPLVPTPSGRWRAWIMSCQACPFTLPSRLGWSFGGGGGYYIILCVLCNATLCHIISYHITLDYIILYYRGQAL